MELAGKCSLKMNFLLVTEAKTTTIVGTRGDCWLV